MPLPAPRCGVGKRRGSDHGRRQQAQGAGIGILLSRQAHGHGELALDVAENAVLAKLASAELPEPLQRDHTEHGVDYYTAAQLHEAHAQGFAAGAASQLSVEPVAFTDEDFMHIFVSADIAQDCGATIELYTWRQAK